MKKALFFTALLGASVLPVELHAQNTKPPANKAAGALETSAFILDKNIWEMNIADFHKKYQGAGFKWQTAAKKSLRSTGRGLTTFGLKGGEMLVDSHDGGKLKMVTLSIYNKGDHGDKPGSFVNGLEQQFTSKIDYQTKVSARKSVKKGAVTVQRQMWSYGNTAILLEKSINKEGGAEFLRLKVASLKTAKQGGRTSNKAALRQNVVYDKATGDVYVDNVPMEDQGRKGYCACASAARVYRYYGQEIDQHEVAQIAGSTAEAGTSIRKMVDSLRKITKHLDSSVLVLYEYPKGLTSGNEKKYNSGLKEMMRDVNSYQSLAKKEKKKGIVIDGKEYGRVPSGYSISFQNFTRQCNPEIYRKIMMKKSSFGRFKSKIKEYVRQGIPVGWCLQLGMFKEQGIPQMGGGHMRLIIGYNEKKNEIIYSDSWGAGHERKKMDAGNAFSMTNCLLVLPPRK